MTDWAVGDLAVCVDDRPCNCGCRDWAIAKGAAYRVTRVWPAGRGGLSLDGIDPMPPHIAFGAIRFRKIRPDEHEPCEAEFATFIKRKKVAA